MSVWRAFVHDPARPVLFCSGTFLLLFTVFILVWSLLQRSGRWRLFFLLGFSYYYYYLCNGAFMLVLAVLTLLDWTIAQQIGDRDGAVRKAWLVLGVGLNLGALGFFKYAGPLLDWMGVASSVGMGRFSIFLPIGISFHIFQSIGYLVDVHRRRLSPVASLLEYAVFLSFYPQVVAGPLVRVQDFLPQIRRIGKVEPHEVSAGLFRIVQGVTKKAIFGDYLGIYVDLVFSTPAAYSGPEVLLAAYAFCGQIYLDFSGYSDMAIGLARILGVRLPENFEAPYAARSVSAFWRRWHMSLSWWLREYLYIPLGGSRRGEIRRYANLLITMLLGGLWHGASLRFVVWGGLHGVILVVEKVLGRWWPSRSWWGRSVGWIMTFHLVVALWIPFRADSFAAAVTVFEGLGNGWGVDRLMTIAAVRGWVVLCACGGIVAGSVPRAWTNRVAGVFQRVPWPVQAGMMVVCVQMVMQMAGARVQPFIYFQF